MLQLYPSRNEEAITAEQWGCSSMNYFGDPGSSRLRTAQSAGGSVMCVMLYLYFKNSRFFFMGIFIAAFIYNY
jgi:hypothetical protein